MQRPWGWEHPGASPSCCSSSSSRGRSFTAPDRTVPLPARLPVTEPRPVEEGRTQPVAPARAQSEPRGAGARGPLGRSTATAAGMRAGPGPPPRPQSKHGGARRHRVVLRPTGAPCGGSSGRVPLPVGTPTGRARQRGPVSPGAAVRAAVPFPPAMKGRGRGRGAGVARLQQRLGDATQENARLRLSLLRSEAGVSQLQAELERLREDLCRRAQRRRREQQALRELSEEHLAFTSYVRMLQSTNGILRESNRSLRSALLLGSWRGPGAVWGDSSLCPCLPTTGPRQSSASSVDTASPHDAGSWSSEDACSASPGQGTQDPQAGEVERCCHPAQHCCKRKLSAFAPEGSGIGEQPTAPNPVYRLMLAGDSGAGKSSFLLRLCRNEFRGDISSTLGVDFQVKQLLVDGEQTTLQIWDTAGQERYRSIARSYFHKAHGVLLLYDISSQSSFLSVRQWIEDIEVTGATQQPLQSRARASGRARGGSRCSAGKTRGSWNVGGAPGRAALGRTAEPRAAPAPTGRRDRAAAHAGGQQERPAGRPAGGGGGLHSPGTEAGYGEQLLLGAAPGGRAPPTPAALHPGPQLPLLRDQRQGRHERGGGRAASCPSSEEDGGLRQRRPPGSQHPSPANRRGLLQGLMREELRGHRLPRHPLSSPPRFQALTTAAATVSAVLRCLHSSGLPERPLPAPAFPSGLPEPGPRRPRSANSSPDPDLCVSP
ncbi:ras-related protein Rab-44-like isoform X2 [Numida meleagris]|uniref:ras-related protein Rab-44-like isoform X2 n=1 Tax=Numida meleagris TaxID=8996 RepID=UPI000B3E3E59|nr:ras-related protein Rab-44-like isoform X2 [Numida meleagris]